MGVTNFVNPAKNNKPEPERRVLQSSPLQFLKTKEASGSLLKEQIAQLREQLQAWSTRIGVIEDKVRSTGVLIPESIDLLLRRLDSATDNLNRLERSSKDSQIR